MAGDEYVVVDATVDGVKNEESIIIHNSIGLFQIYLISQDEVADIILSWLSKCNEIRKLGLVHNS